jgi:hypothetical protein
VAATRAHAGIARTSERRVHTRAGVQDVAMANGVVEGQQRDALRGVRRTQDRPLSTSQRQLRGPQMEESTRSGGGPGERFLAETRRGNRGWVHRQFQMPEDFPDHRALRDGGDHPQRPLLAERTARHV